MLRPRVSPTLLLHNGGLVKTRRFAEPRYVGDPINAVRIFREKEVDELFIFDIDATAQQREPDYALIETLAAECAMPLCYGGGVCRADQAQRLIGLGVEKVAVSSAAIARPELVSEMAAEVGQQSVCVVLDTRRVPGEARHELMLHRGRQGAPHDPVATAIRFAKLGAGEIVFNAVDRDGMREGYDLDLAANAQLQLSVPFTMLGGAGTVENLSELFKVCGPIGASAGSLFVFKGDARAVLITYPDRATRDRLALIALSESIV